MTLTDKKHWKNGHEVRGGYFHTLTLSLLNFGLMLTWNKGLNKQPRIYIFKFNKGGV